MFAEMLQIGYEVMKEPCKMKPVGKQQGPVSPIESRISLRESRFFSRAVAKAFEVFEILRKSPRPLTLTQLAYRVGLTKSSLLRILQTLEGSGYIVKNADGHYGLTPEGRTLAPAGFTASLVALAKPCLRELVREFRETVALAILFDNHIEVVEVVESPEMVRMGNTKGRILPPHASALGKSIAAFQTEETCERLLRSYGLVRFTPNTISDEVALKEEFDRIRLQGYAIDREESAVGGQCFGSPIFSEDQRAVAAISISVPTIRLRDPETQERLIQRLIDACGRLAEGLKKPTSRRALPASRPAAAAV
jgi:DNA-binding IclR family transcriptional regulator